MIPFIRNIRRNYLENGRFSNYLLYAFGEIVLLVVGILVALQFNDWQEEKVERTRELSVYQSIRQQSKDDRKELVEVRKYNFERQRAYIRANQIISARELQKKDSLAMFAMLLAEYSDFHRDASIYDNLSASGQLERITNPEILKYLQLLDKSLTFSNNLESMHWDMILNELSPQLRLVVDYNSQKAVNPEKLYGLALQNFFVESIYLTAYKEAIYGRTLSEIDSLLNRIEAETGKGPL